ncbi:MAG TPA: hypothetical protein VFN61_04550 [Acidimicrobiales bacterium]|nr:hypothetical protein [Acidimicrobiales bacterium]
MTPNTTDQSWAGQLAARRAEASRPLEEREAERLADAIDVPAIASAPRAGLPAAPTAPAFDAVDFARTLAGEIVKGVRAELSATGEQGSSTSQGAAPAAS